MTSFILIIRPLPFPLKKGRQIRLTCSKNLSHLNEYPNIKHHLIINLQFALLFPMHVSEEVPAFIVDHDASVECMEFDEAILPAFGLPSNVVGVETAVFVNWRGLLRGSDSDGVTC